MSNPPLKNLPYTWMKALDHKPLDTYPNFRWKFMLTPKTKSKQKFCRRKGNANKYQNEVGDLRFYEENSAHEKGGWARMWPETKQAYEACRGLL